MKEAVDPNKAFVDIEDIKATYDRVKSQSSVVKSRTTRLRPSTTIYGSS